MKLSRIPLLLIGLLLTSRAVADDSIPSDADMCHRSMAVGRGALAQGAFDTSPEVAT